MSTNGLATQADSLKVFFADDAEGTNPTADYDCLPGATSRNNLSLAGDWQFSIPQTLWNPTTMKVGRYAFVRATFPSHGTEGTTFMVAAGKIDDVAHSKGPRGLDAMTFSGLNFLGDLGETELEAVEIFETVLESPLRVHGLRWREVWEDGTWIKKIDYWNTIDKNPATFNNVRFDSLVDQTMPTWEDEPSRLLNHIVYLYIGNSAPFDLIDIKLGTNKNSQPGSLELQYFNPAFGWETVALTADTTAVGGAPFAQDGFIWWPKVDREGPVTHDEFSAYWLRISIRLVSAPFNWFDVTEITCRTAGAHSAALTAIMAYAPAGWGITHTTTVTPHQLSGRGEAVLALLCKLAERSGENFAIRYGVGQEWPVLPLPVSRMVQWIPTPTACGYTLRETPASGHTHTTAYLTDFKRVTKRTELVSRVKMIGGGSDPVAELTLSALEPGTFASLLPAGYAVAGDLLINTTLEATGVQVLKTMKHPDIGALQGGTGVNRQAARELLRAGVAYLKKHAQHAEFFSCSVGGLRSHQVYAGRTIRVVAPLRDANGSITENIDKNLVITRATVTVDASYMLRWQLELANVAEHTPDSVLTEALIAIKTQRGARHPQPTSTSHLVGRTAVEGGGGGGGSGGGDGVSQGVFDAHIAETTTAHGIPTQIDTKVAAHAALPNAHHNKSHVLASTVGLGSDHTVTGLTEGQVLIATSATAARFWQLLHNQIAGVTPNDHHNQSHVLASTAGLGSDHTVSGLTAGQVLKATGAAAAHFGQLLHSQTGGITPSDHHNPVTVASPLTLATQHIGLDTGNGLVVAGGQVYVLIDGFSALEFEAGTLRMKRGDGIGLTGDGKAYLVPITLSATSATSASPSGTHSHAITNTDNAHTTPGTLLRGSASGNLTLRSLIAMGSVDILNGGDLTVGTTLVVDQSEQAIGVGGLPDPQFMVTVHGPLYAEYLIGKMALQIPDATLICHFDRSLQGHRAQPAAVQTGSIIYPKGKFNEGLALFGGLTNLVSNPSLETNATGWNSFSAGTVARTDAVAYRGQWSLLAESGGLQSTVQAAWTSGLGTLDATAVYSMTFAIQNKNLPPAGQVYAHFYWYGGANADNSTGGEALATIGPAGKWQEISRSFQADYADRTGVYVYIAVTGVTANGQGFYLDGVTIVKQAFAPPIFDGDSNRCSWTGTAHASTSTYVAPNVQYETEKVLSTAEGTIAAWVKVPVTATAKYAFGTGHAETNNSLTLGIAGSNIFVEVGGSDSSLPVPLVANEWAHMALRWGSGTFQSFFNGVKITDDPHGSIGPLEPTIRIGSRSDGLFPLNGEIDDLLIVERALADEEILAIALSNAPVFAEVSTAGFETNPEVDGGTVWANGRGFFARGDDGEPLFAIAITGRPLSWGGFDMGKGDVVMGNATDGYIRFQKIAQKLTINADVEELRVANDTVRINSNGVRATTADGTITLNENGLNFTAYGGSDALPTTPQMVTWGDASKGMQIWFQDNSSFSKTARIVVRQGSSLASAMGLSVDLIPSADGAPAREIRLQTQRTVEGFTTRDALELAFDAGAGSLILSKAAGSARLDVLVDNSAGSPNWSRVPLALGNANAGWVNLTLQNSWTGSAQYRLTNRGTVILRGSVSGGSSPTAVIATLPVGRRPLIIHRAAAATGGAAGAGRLDVGTDGTIKFAVGGVIAGSYLDNIEFYVI